MSTSSRVRSKSLRALIHAYHARASGADADRTVTPSAVERSSSSPEADTSNGRGTSIRTVPLSPNAQARKVTNAWPTRTSLSERGLPPGSSKVSRSVACSRKNRLSRSPTVTSL